MEEYKHHAAENGISFQKKIPLSENVPSASNRHTSTGQQERQPPSSI